MKRMALAVLAVTLLVPQAFGGPWIKSLSTAQKKAKDSQRLIFVDLFADWCGWCHKMEQEVFPSQVFQNATDGMVLLRLNTEDNGEGTRLAQQYGITSLPTFLVLAPDMTVAGIIRGYAPAPEFVQTLDTVEKKYDDFKTRVQQEPAYANDYQKRLDLAREFTQRQKASESEIRLKKLVAEPKVPASIRDQAYYELATAQAVQGHMDDATRTIAAFSKVQSKGEVFEHARLMQAQIYFQQGNLEAAAKELRSFRGRFPNSALAGNAEILLAQIENRLKASR